MTSLRRASAAFAVLAAVAAGSASAAAGEIRGRLLLAGRPASGVTLSAVPYELPETEARRLARQEAAPRPLAETTTRTDGTFAVTVSGAPGAAFRLLAEGGGAMPSWVGGTYDASESDDLGEHALARAEALTGRVVGATGVPIAGAAVTVVALAPPGADPELVPAARTVTAGADGVFRSGEAAADGNRVTVIAKSYGAVTVTNVRAGTLSKPIALGLGALASGVVLGSDRQSPAAGALVRFEAEGLATAWVEAGADGRFQLSDLPARAGTVVAEGGAAGLGGASTGPLPRPGGRTLTVVLAAPPTVEGQVLDARTRAPVPRVRVTLEDGTRSRTDRTAPDGRYRIRGLLPQRAYRLRADEPRYTPYLRNRILLLTAETLRLDVPLTLAATLAGRVVDESGKPVAGALGRLIPSAGTGASGRWQALRTADRLVFRSGADGTFKAARLPAGDEQRLAIVHPDYEPRTIGGLSLPPGQVRTVNVTLHRGLSIAGRVRDEAGRPVPDADVEIGNGSGLSARAARVLGMSALATARPRAITGTDGRFEVKGLSEGAYSLTVTKSGFADHRLERVPIGTERRDPIEITLAAGASIRGTVSRKDGTGAEGYRIRAVAADSSGPGFGPFGLGGLGGGAGAGDLRPTGPDGAFALSGLRPGESYDLVVLGPDGVGPRREGVAAPAEDVAIVVAGPGRIAGRVLDAQTGSPIPDFEVDFGPDRSSGRGGFGPGGGGGRALARVMRAMAGGTGGGPQPVHSDDGAFALEDVPPGTWEVVAHARGYQTARVGGVTVEEGGTRDAGDVRLVPGNAIRGQVLDGASGVPVLDASVSAQRAGGGGRALALLMGEADARTDADGRFSIEGLAAGSYTVVAQHPDFANASTLAEVKEGPVDADLRMTPGGTLGGVVLSETSSPLAGASVTLSAGGGGGGFGRGGGAAFGGGQSTVTDETGRFRFLHVTAGRYSIAAGLRGHQTTPADVVLQAGETRDNVVLSLASGARLHGVVSGLAANLRANVGISASGPDGYFASTRTLADGTFELTGVPPGPINLRASAGEGGGSMRSATAQVAIAEGQDDAQVQVVFEAGFSLGGTVTRNGQPVAGATVTASLAGNGRMASARTDASGVYRLDGLSEGSYTVTVLPADGTGGAPHSQSTTLSGDATLDLVIPFARLGGTVVDSGTGQPLADAVVQAASGAGGRGRSATTDSNGRFALEDLDAIAYTVTVRRDGYELQTRDVTAAEGASDDLRFELSRGVGIGIEVRDAAFGVPLRAIQVRATNGGTAPAFSGTVPLDADGRGEIPSLSPGSYVLAVYASGYGPAIVGATAPAPRVLIALGPGGAIEIHAGPVTLAHGTARVQILGAGGQPYPFSFFAPDGRLVLAAPIRRVENLGPGSYLLQAEAGEPRPFDVQSGGLTVVTLP